MTIEGDQPAARRPPEKSLGKRTARAAMWMAAQSIGVKFTATFGHLILMALLVKEDWGIYSLAISVKALLDVFGQLGMQAVLVQRHAKFDRWATPAFWMTLSTGILAMLVFIGLAPQMAAAYDEPQLQGLLLLLAINPPILALGVIPRTRMRCDLRFKAIAAIEFIGSIGALVATVILAALDFGPFSFVIPLPFMEVWRTGASWYLTRPKIRMKPQFRRWKLLLGDSRFVLASDILTRVISQADYLILGMFHPIAIVGAYSVAFRLSIQSMLLITGNLRQALLPALSKLQFESNRQLNAFLRAGRMLTTVFTPVALLQAAVSDPLLRMFGTEYLEAIPILQVLSLSMLFRAMNGPAVSLLRSQGRFRTNMLLQMQYVFAFLIVAFSTAAFWGALEMAIGISIVVAFYGPIQTYIAIRPSGGTLKNIADLYLTPALPGLLAFSLAWGSRWLIPPTLTGFTRYIFEIGIVSMLGCGVYAAILRWFMPTLWFELFEQISNILPGKRSRTSHDTNES